MLIDKAKLETLHEMIYPVAKSIYDEGCDHCPMLQQWVWDGGEWKLIFAEPVPLETPEDKACVGAYLGFMRSTMASDMVVVFISEAWKVEFARAEGESLEALHKRAEERTAGRSLEHIEGRVEILQVQYVAKEMLAYTTHRIERTEGVTARLVKREMIVPTRVEGRMMPLALPEKNQPKKFN